MTLRNLCLLSIFGYALSMSSGATSARAAESGGAVEPVSDVLQARQYFSQGLKLYKDGDFDAALVQFERAYATKPSYKVLYNIAQANFELRQYVEARDALARYLAGGSDAIEPDRREAVAKDLAELARRIAHLKLEVNVAGAAVYVDGKRIGTTPLGDRIDVNEGQRTISVEAPERGQRQRVVRLAGGEEQTISIDFPNESRRPIVSTAAPKTVSPATAAHGPGAGFWATAVGAVALGAGAGVTGYLALRAEDDRSAELKRFGVKQSELDDSESRAKNLALTSDILAGAALLCAGTAVVIWATTPKKSEVASVGLSLGPASARLNGRF